MKKTDTSARIKEALEIRNMKQTDLVLKTGIDKGQLSSYISGKYKPRQTNLHLLANALGVDEAWLMGFDVPMERSEDKKTVLTQRDERDILKILALAKEQLLSQEGLMCDGNPATPEAVESILSAMEIGMEMAKKKNKEKYTPKKYKKD